MAGEWLKFDASTPDKPEVFAITVAMGWDDPDLTVGKLLRVWRWFDQQTIDGNAPNVTLALLDRISGVTGFSKAMCDVGWLVANEGGLCLPHFDRHNGKTAKDRALTAKRVALHKAKSDGNDEGNGAGVSGALPREEKKREEKKEPKSTASPAAPVDTNFESAWSAYPLRSGASKADSLKQWKARIKAGASADQIIAGVKRYAAYVIARRTEDSYIKQPATFFGPGKHYESDWAVPMSSAPAGNSQLGKAGQQTAAAAQQWLEQSNA